MGHYTQGWLSEWHPEQICSGMHPELPQSPILKGSDPKMPPSLSPSSALCLKHRMLVARRRLYPQQELPLGPGGMLTWNPGSEEVQKLPVFGVHDGSLDELHHRLAAVFKLGMAPQAEGPCQQDTAVSHHRGAAAGCRRSTLTHRLGGSSAASNRARSASMASNETAEQESRPPSCMQIPT